MLMYRTGDPRALTWWETYQARLRAAEVNVARFIEALHAVDRSFDRVAAEDVAVSLHGDALEIMGLKPAPLLEPLPGMRLRDGLLVPATELAAGLRITDLAEQCSASGLLAGSEAIGIASKVSDMAPRIHSFSGALLQVWPNRPGVKRAVRRCAAISGVQWLHVRGRQRKAAIAALGGAADGY